MDPIEKAKHLAMVEWNDYTCKRLGFKLRKEKTDLCISLSVWHGELHLFHCWHEPPNDNSSVELHKELETFLLEYMDHLFKLKDYRRAYGHMIEELKAKPERKRSGPWG